IRREIVSLIQIRHPNVLPILGISSSSGHPLSIITPFASNGNALEFLEELPAERRVDAMLGIVTNIASALDYLHVMDPPIVHGDLHGGNILIDAEGTCLLSDFGLARIKHEKTRSRTTIFEGGRFRYLAPELLADDVHEFRTTPKSDCYAFAMTVLELATLKPPFAEYEDERSVSSAVQSGTRPKRPEQDAFGDLGKAREKMLWTILTKLWAQNPARR
ncbi:kinase-like protein, partial [Clavulina sp. PMI_390]